MMDLVSVSPFAMCESCGFAISGFIDKIYKSPNARIVRSSAFLINFSNSKCALCRLLTVSVKKGLLDSNHYMNVRLRLDYTGNTSDSNLLFIENADDQSLYSADRGYIQCFADGVNLSSHFPSGRRVGDPGSAATMEKIRVWTQKCQQTHADCRLGVGVLEINDNSELPSRVLDVKAMDEDPLLFVTHGECARFIALSHCWGGQGDVMTTQSNYKTQQQGIRFESLPKTFQDAVRITRELGIKYLWIDSLCIIQDDVQDWIKEAKLMGQIYEKAFCTIAAVDASNDTGGCFTQKGRYEYLVCIPGKDKQETVHLAKAWPNRNLYWDRGPLFTRGWVLQERLLSRRILHFAGDQVFWECREVIQGEDGAVPISTPLFKLRKKLFECITSLHRGTSRTNSIGIPVAFNPHMRLVNIWTEAVKFYTSCALTKPEDRIPALLGMADRIQGMTQMNCLYGCFFDNSPFSLRILLWHRRDQHLTYPETARTPSWSWASCNGAVTYHYNPQFDDDFQIRDCDKEVRGSKLFPVAKLLEIPNVSVKEGLARQPLIISACVIRATRGMLLKSEPIRNHSTSSWPMGSYQFRAGESQEYGHNRVCYDRVAEANQPTDFLLMPLFAQRSGSSNCEGCNHGKKTLHSTCLVLESIGPSPRGDEYRRIGMALLLGESEFRTNTGNGTEESIHDRKIVVLV